MSVSEMSKRGHAARWKGKTKAERQAATAKARAARWAKGVAFDVASLAGIKVRKPKAAK